MIHPEQSRISVGLENQGIEPTSDVEAILRIGNPMELRKRLLDYIGQHSESEVDLVDLAGALHALEPNVFFDVDVVRQKHEAMKEGRKRGQSPFYAYLREYLREAVKAMAVKVIDLRNAQEAKAVEARLAQEAEQARREAAAREKAEAAEVEKLVPVIRQEILAEMGQRIPHFDHSPEHQKVISLVNKKGKIGHGFGGKEMIEGEKLSSEREYLLGALMEKHGFFGSESKVFHTDVYDDYTKQADLAVVTKDGPVVLVDITHKFEDAGEKLYFNQQNPERILAYPPHPDLIDKRGIPIMLGISKGDADDLIGQFLKSEARERLGIKSETETEQVYGESFGRWLEYILLQLEHQRDYILEHSQYVDSGDAKLLADYNAALKDYDKTIRYFEDIKNKRSSSIRLNGERYWDREMMSISSSISQYETREGLEDFPAPSFSEVSRAVA